MCSHVIGCRVETACLVVGECICFEHSLPQILVHPADTHGNAEAKYSAMSRAGRVHLVRTAKSSSLSAFGVKRCQ